MEVVQTSFGRNLKLPLLSVAIVSFKDTCSILSTTRCSHKPRPRRIWGSPKQGAGLLWNHAKALPDFHCRPRWEADLPPSAQDSQPQCF